MMSRLVTFVPAVVWMLLIFYLSSRQRFPQPPGFPIDFAAIAAHLFLFGVLAVLLLIPLRRILGATTRAALLAIALTSLYGFSDEIHQSFVPGRQATIFDIVVDTVGAVVATVFWIYVEPRNRWLPGR